MFKRILGLGLALGMAFAPVCAMANTPTSEVNDAILYFVNDPQELSLCDVNKIVDLNKNYQHDRGTLNDDQIANFFQHMQDYGVMDAGKGTNQCQAGLVVQSQGPEANGVLVLKGEFDRNKLLGMLQKHYVEHSTEHSAAVIKQQQGFAKAQNEKAENPYVQFDTSINGCQAHIFPMPLRNRELIVVSSPNGVLISSANRGQRDLLNRTLAVVQGKVPTKQPAPNTKVTFTYSASKAEKQQLDQRIWARYDAQKKDAISEKPRMKRLGERVRQKVIRSKIDFMVASLDEMQQSTMTIERGREGEMTKTAVLVSTFDSADRANDVKKRLMKHMIKEIKRQDNVQDKFALGNVSITTQGNQTIIRCQLKDSKEQVQCFNLISSYVAKGMLERL